MRSRDEVLREFPVDLQGIRDSYMEISAYHVERMADRIRELEALVDKLTEKNLNLSIECDGLEDELRHATTPTRGRDE